MMKVQLVNIPDKTMGETIKSDWIHIRVGDKRYQIKEDGDGFTVKSMNTLVVRPITANMISVVDDW